MAGIALSALLHAHAALAQPADAEREVYGAVLRALTTPLSSQELHTFVVAGSTVLLEEAYQRLGSALGDVAQDLADRLPDVPEEMREDLLRKQVAPGLVAFPAQAFPSYIRLIVVPSGELAQYLASGSQDDWQAFRSTYQNAHGVLEMSRVGFDASGAYAIVFVSERCPDLCGFGQYVILQREAQGTWTVLNTYLVWIA